jgi:heterodisulfide reductase subunit B
VLPARNLALAERAKVAADMAVPCSACYLNLRRVEEDAGRDGRLSGMINEALYEEGLRYEGRVRARHLLDVLANDVGAARIAENVKRKLEGLRIAPYYGCQCLRPYRGFDDPELPVSMEPLLRALGADVHRWSMGGKCCGAGLMTTKKEVALKLVGSLLSAARGADCIATVCPLCQMNLESFQGNASRRRGEDLGISVLYLPQLIGLAFGLPEEDVKLRLNFALTAPLREKLGSSVRT